MHQHEPRRPVQRRDQPHHEEKTALRGFEDLHWKPNKVVHDEQQPQHLARLDEVSLSCGRQAVDASLSSKGYIQIQKLIYIYIMNPIYILVSPEAADPGWKCRLRFWFASLRNEYIHINHHTPVSTLTQIYQNLTFCMPRNPRWVWMSGTPYGATIVHRFSYAPFISVPRHLVCDSLGWAWIGDQSADATPKSLPRCWATLLRPVFSGWKDVGRQKSTVV
jgi:hypothetical protein